MDVASTLPLWSIIPFVGMLLSIAICPMVKPEWWEKNQLLVAAFWSLLFCIPFAIGYGILELAEKLVDSVVLDYIPFIVLLLGLFVATGGIVIKGTIAGTTKNNTILLLIGTALASWIGTTGAAMLLVRPLIRANAWRKNKAHIVVFFIFLVANIGGCLTPLGDPPLFLGYLRGIPFFWTLQNIVPLLLFNVAILTVVFIFIDRHFMKKELAEGRSPHDLAGNENAQEKLGIDGWHNFFYVGLIIVAVILNGVLNGVGPQFTIFPALEEGAEPITIGINYFVEIILILVAIALSLATTSKECRERNEFTYGPIEEVAKLFIGIFITMIPALILLRANGSSLGIDTPLKFFWATGALSSFLDNSPTYVVFLTTAGSLGAVEGVASTVGTVAATNLLAISAGAVFMGANTYIGNAPNFMVRNIAEAKGIPMPSFFGYMGWSCAILVPVFILDTLIFFL